MDLIDKRERIVSPSDIREFCNRCDIAIHRIHALEGDDPRARRLLGTQERFEVSSIVVVEDADGCPAATDALNHRVVIVGVGVDHALGQHAAEHGERGEVGDPARREEQRGLLAMPRRELALERHVHAGRARDVAGTTAAGAVRCGL